MVKDEFKEDSERIKSLIEALSLKYDGLNCVMSISAEDSDDIASITLVKGNTSCITQVCCLGLLESSKFVEAMIAAITTKAIDLEGKEKVSSNLLTMSVLMRIRNILLGQTKECMDDKKDIDNDVSNLIKSVFG